MSLTRSSDQKGLFITFEGTEGSGKSTQIARLSDRLKEGGYTVRTLREPGATPIGEEIRHTLKHSQANRQMTPVTELLLLNASRAQLVSEVIRPALDAGEVVLCDRFHDSTIVYQGFGRELPMTSVESVVNLAIGKIKPHLTILLDVSVGVSESRRESRNETRTPDRDRFEEAGRAFFQRVEKGFRSIAANEPDRIKVVDGSQPIDRVEAAIWEVVKPNLERLERR